MFLKYLCEFLGTMMLILLGDGVVANVTLNKSGMKGAGSIQITIAWGVSENCQRARTAGLFTLRCVIFS